MRIGIDAREICGHATGVGRYLSGLLREWSTGQRASGHEFVLYAPTALNITLDARKFATRVVPGGGGTLWEQRQLPAAFSRDHLDIFFAPGYTAPLLGRVPVVTAIHDVSFMAHPEWFPTREGIRRRFLTRQAAAVSRAVITISEFSRGELIEWLNVSPARVHVIPPGVDAPGHDAGANLPTGATGLPQVLFVGSIFNRRHVPDLIRAVGQLARRRPDVLLALVGDNRSYPEEDIDAIIGVQRLGSQVRWHPYVPDAELAALYCSSRAFAFLSEYEGLGLTPLEGLAFGLPPVLLDTPVARESCEDAAVYVPKADIGDVADALERVLFDPATRLAVLSAAPRVLAKYSWTRAANDTLDVIERAL